MSVSLVNRLFAFFDNIWSFILTLVRSLLALFSFRRRSSDPFTISSLKPAPSDALTRAHSNLRPILLTPRSIARSPAYYTQRAQTTRSRSATSTLFPGHNDNAIASASLLQPSDPQRTSPKLDPDDPELGLSVFPSFVGDQAEPPGASATSFHGGTPDMSFPTTHTASLGPLPLTPPDRCYLAPMPSVTDCPYAEPWPTFVNLDRGKPKLPGSPLKVSINTNSAITEPIVDPMDSPSPGHWSPVQIWTSTPCKNDQSVLDPAVSPFEHYTGSTMDRSSALVNISHALISRSRRSIQPYDDASNSGTPSDTSPSVNYSLVAETLQRSDPAHERCPTHAQVPPLKNQPCPRFHYPDAYTYAWRHHSRVPGKSGRMTSTRSYSHMDLPMSEWYDDAAYIHSPVSALSPPKCDSATEDEDEDEDDMPLGRVRARLVRQSAGVGASLGLDHPISISAGVSPRTRRMSEGCLLAISESTPTRVGFGAHTSENALPLALDGGEHSFKDWLEVLSLRFSSERKDAVTPVSEPPINVAAVGPGGA